MSRLAAALASANMYMSKFAVMPAARYSRMASFARWYTSSAVSFASIGNTCWFSQSSSGRSSA